MKKAFSVLLAMVILYNVLGHYIVFKSIQYQIRKDIKNLILQNTSNNTLIDFDTSLPIFLSKAKFIHPKEFLYQGQLFDVVKKKIIKGAVHLLCINDNKEEKLISAYRTQCGETSSKNFPVSGNTFHCLKLLLKDYWVSSVHNIFMLPIGFNYYFNFSIKLLTGIHRILPLPPWNS